MDKYSKKTANIFTARLFLTNFFYTLEQKLLVKYKARADNLWIHYAVILYEMMTSNRYSYSNRQTFPFLICKPKSIRKINEEKIYHNTQRLPCFIYISRFVIQGYSYQKFCCKYSYSSSFTFLFFPVSVILPSLKRHWQYSHPLFKFWCVCEDMNPWRV